MISLKINNNSKHFSKNIVLNAAVGKMQDIVIKSQLFDEKFVGRTCILLYEV